MYWSVPVLPLDLALLAHWIPVARVCRKVWPFTIYSLDWRSLQVMSTVAALEKELDEIEERWALVLLNRKKKLRWCIWHVRHTKALCCYLKCESANDQNQERGLSELQPVENATNVSHLHSAVAREQKGTHSVLNPHVVARNSFAWYWIP